MKTFFSIGAILLVLLGLSVWWSRSMPSDKSGIISTTGIHWHPELEIYVDGEKLELPKNKGIETAPHNPVHTHEDLPLIHLEFEGLVREDDIRLGKWFEVWGRDFRGFGKNVSMTVSGVENTEFENYIMKDGDKIILRYSN